MSLIEVNGLCKSYGDLKVLKGIDLSVEEGERIAIIGGSGTGKSVFLRSLELLEQPDEGRILIDGQEITARGADVDQIRRSMGMVYQKFHLFTHMDVMDNLCLAPVKLLGMTRQVAEKKALDLLGQMGLAAWAHAKPASLSGGQQQRVAICRSLMMDPKVLLFDEPTSALDPSMVGEVLAVIRMLAKRSMTMLIVTHEMNFAKEIATRVLYLADGIIYEEGTPEQIFDHPQKEKTIAFIQNIKSFEFEINDRLFDLMRLQGGIQTFGEKYGISHAKIYRLQITAEELIYEFLNNCYKDENIAPDIFIQISYAELDRSIGINITSAGEAYNPLEHSDDDVHLGVTILQRIAKELEYRFEDGVNKMHIRL